MLCKRGLCRHAVSVCLSVCVSDTFVNSAKTNKLIFEMFSPSGSQSIVVFATPNGMAISSRKPPDGGIECRWGRKTSLFWAFIWLHCVLSTLRQEMCYQHGAARPWQVVTLIAVLSRGVCWWRETTTKCLWQEVLTLRQIEQHLMKTFIRHIGRKHREIEYKK